MTTRLVDDARRWAAFHTAGTFKVLMDVHATLEDARGALARGQLLVAAYNARETILACLSVRAIAAGGELWADRLDPFHDPFAGVAVEEYAPALDIVRRFATAESAEDGRAAYDELAEYVRQTERLLGFASSPASIRTPYGLFPALRTARQLQQIIEAAHLPQILPTSWTGAPTGGQDTT
jgi:hypothetical protein